MIQQPSTIADPHPYNKIGDGPEGPEIRTVSDKLQLSITGLFIYSVEISERASAKGMERLIFPERIRVVKSYGKKLLMDTDRGNTLVASFGMGGRFQYQRGNNTHITLHLGTLEGNGKMKVIQHELSLHFDDSRYMGSVDLVRTEALKEYLGDIGPDLLFASLKESTWITSEEWISIFTRKKYSKWSIGKLLLEQSSVSGIGNYLKSEILYYCSIHPNRIVGTITMDEWETLRVASHKIIALSYYLGGFTIESFISPDGRRGEYKSLVYGRSFDDEGNRVLKIKSKDGRTSHIVEQRQRLD